MGAIRTDDVEPARGDDAVSAARFSSGLALRLLESRLHLSRARRRADQRRPLGRLRPEEHLRATRAAVELLPLDALLPRPAPVTQLLHRARLGSAGAARAARRRFSLPAA